MNVSVIVPVYNVEPYLKRCINSLIDQKYNSYEIILVDDGSTDASSEICDDYARSYDYIRVLHKSNGGLSSARNYGVKYAKGEYVTFVDSDDYVSITYLSDMIDLKDKYNSDMVCTRVVVQSEEEAKTIQQNQFDDFVLDGRDSVVEVYVNSRVGWSACGKLFKTELIKKMPFPGGFYEEMASTYLYLFACHNVAFGDYSSNYHYIRREGSITDRPLSKEHYRIFEVCDEIEQFIHENYKNHEYIPVLLRQNATLQLLTKLTMEYSDYCYIFNKYKSYFRQNLFLMLSSKDVVKKSKYYSIILCTTPILFRLQRRIITKVKGE